MFRAHPGDATRVADTLESTRLDIERRLTEIQVELDGIGSTFGMQPRRSVLTREKNELLDQLLALRSVAV